MSGHVQRTCRIDGCDRRSNNDGLCRPHYRRLVEHGDPLATPIESRTPRRAGCSVEGCERTVRSRGLCASHQRNGPEWVPKRMVSRPATEMLRHYSSPEGDCLIWKASRIYSGYGMAWDAAQGKQVLAHRLAYETWVGPIPTGMDIDHTCRNRACIEPSHLRPQTPRENRGRARRSA